MISCGSRIRRLFLALLLAALCLFPRGDGVAHTAAPVPFATVMPPTVVWAWEEPEDLRAASSASVGVAYLAETLILGTQPGLSIVPRHQPLVMAPGSAVMAVVRLIAVPGFQDQPDIRQRTAEALAQVAHHQGVRALQVDFDATRSQREFYASVLTMLRPRMPAGMPLSITALLSWCAAAPDNGNWLAALPIDEAVPMFFRLGGRARPGQDKSGYTLREPLCQGSRGISTDESWPPVDHPLRLYVFAPHPWTPLQLAALNNVHRGQRPPALQQGYDSESLQPNDTGLPPPSPEKLP
jgi:hypothetical protein